MSEESYEPRPYSAAAADRNQQPLLEVLREVFAQPADILEIGSGTGQHAVFFAHHLPWLRWQPSDQARFVPGIRSRVAHAQLPNLLPPLTLDVNQPWPVESVGGVFSANTAHIMGWPTVSAMFIGVGRVLAKGGAFALYGPFNYDGKFTSDSNRQFDAMLRARSPEMGVRDFERLDELARLQGLRLVSDYEMPANNRTLVWRRAL